ncbi:MAG: class I SAM-dependent methyltransferase [Kofleriaceae bacterium]
MSKRDDDPSDMEVGMTTAERRRRRRRGGGLRVPSDNVPRRTTPPVVAPVPEDPSLAMSIAYSFASDASGPVAAGEPAVHFEEPRRTTAQQPPLTFVEPVAPEVISTLIEPVIDPVSAPVEQADFETQTREMSAVDLAALGLAESDITGSNQYGDAGTTDPGLPGIGVEVRFRQPEPASTVEVQGITTLDVPADPEPEPEALDERDGEDAPEVTTAPADPEPEVAKPVRRERLQTVALTEEDLEEVREAVRAATAAPVAPVAPVAPPRSHTPTPAPPLRAHTPTPPPPIGGALGATVPPAPPRPASAPSAATEMWGEKVVQPRPAARTEESPPLTLHIARPQLTTSNATQPLSPQDVERVDEPQSVPEIDIQDLAERADTSGEFEVDVEDAEAAEVAPAAAAAPAEPCSERPASVPPPIAAAAAATPANPATATATAPVAPTASTTQPGVPPPPTPAAKDPHHPPPPPPAAPKPPPAPPPVKKDPKPAAPRPEGKGARTKAWFVDLFDEDYLRTLPFLTPQATQAEAEFVANAMSLTPGAQVLDVGCGYGRHAMELAARGFHVVGLDLSTPLLVRGGEEANRRGLQINFVRGDMRELDFEAQFDGAYCLFSTFGYFDDETNKKTVANIARALKPGGRVLIEILNRDYVIADLPTRVWWEGDGCVVLEEVELNYFSSRIQVNRSVVFDDGRQLEQEISVRAYSLHEVGKLMHAAGFRVLEVSGGYQTRGRFFGNQSRHIIVLAERKETTPA